MSIVLALTLGILIIVTPIANGNIANRIGNFGASFYNYLFATLTAGLLFLILPGKAIALSVVHQDPLTLTNGLIGGLLGCFVLLSLNYVAPRIKAFQLVILTFLGQMGTGLILDYYMLGIADYKRFIGLVLIAVGLLLQQTNKTNKRMPYTKKDA